MQLFSMKLSAWAVVAALGTVSLFAQAAPAARGKHNGGKFAREMAASLNLTPDQSGQVKAIFRESTQSARPIRQQLMETRKSLRAAVKAGDADQIQKLAATEGTEAGQLSAIRATALSKVYKVLTPDQQQKLEELQQSRRGKLRGARS